MSATKEWIEGLQCEIDERESPRRMAMPQHQPAVSLAYPAMSDWKAYWTKLFEETGSL
jgi:hypothetical protein